MDQTGSEKGHIARLVRAARRYALTWQAILLKPDNFVKIPLNQRKQTYTSPYVFLSVSLLLLNYGTAPIAWALAKLADTPAPDLNLKSLVDPSTLSMMIPEIVSITIQAFLWYVVMHKWLGHRFTVPTSTPFRRIFQELLYVNAPIAVLSNVGLLVGVGGWAYVTMLVIPAVAILGLGATKVLVGPILIIYALITLLLIPGPLILPGLFYNTVIARTLFRLPRSRAVKLCLTISFVSILPMLSYGLATKLTLPQYLTYKENRAVRDLRSLGAVEKHYYDTEREGELLPISQVSAYTRSIPNDDGWKKAHSKEVTVLLQFASEQLDGYTFSIEPNRNAGTIHANPKKYGGLTIHSFAADIESQKIYAADKHGQNANADDRVLFGIPIH